MLYKKSLIVVHLFAWNNLTALVQSTWSTSPVLYKHKLQILGKLTPDSKNCLNYLNGLHK